MPMMLAFDNETHLISRARPLPKVVCSAFKWAEGEKLLLADGVLLGFLQEVLATPDVHFVGCNVAYDFGTLAATWPALLPAIFDAYKAGRVTDVAIRQQLFDIALGRTFADDKVTIYSLDRLAKEILGHGLEGKSAVHGDGWRLRYSELDGVPVKQWPAAAQEYALNDARATFEIWQAQEDAAHLMQAAPFQTYAAFCLALISARGMVTDPAAVAASKAHHEKEKVRILPELMLAGLVVNGVKKVKPAQLRIQQGCEAQGIPVPTTEKGNISTDKEACLLSGDPLMMRRAEYMTAELMLNTYIPVLEAGCSGLPVTTWFQLAGTGRTTSSAPREPLVGGNLQNAPRKGQIRECFKPRDGFVYCVGDFSGAELHTLAQVLHDKFGHTALGQTLRAKRDVHAWLASYLLGCSYADMMEGLQTGDKACTEARQQAKAGNFGFPGGMGISTFISTQLRQAEKVWTVEQASALKKAWLLAYPEMDEYFQAIKHELGPDGCCTVQLPMGMLRQVSGFSAAANTYFQGGAAAAGKLALCEVVRRCYAVPDSNLYGSFPVNWIHDELVLEVPADVDASRAALEEFEAVMAQEFNRVVPEYPTKVDALLTKKWSKKAKRLQNAAGEVIPWE